MRGPRSPWGWARPVWLVLIMVVTSALVAFLDRSIRAAASPAELAAPAVIAAGAILPGDLVWCLPSGACPWGRVSKTALTRTRQAPDGGRAGQPR
jgi:hypothetical protein